MSSLDSEYTSGNVFSLLPYSQDYSVAENKTDANGTESSDFNMSTVYQVRSASDLNQLPLTEDLVEFERNFRLGHANSDVHIYRVVSLVYIFRRVLTDYDTPKEQRVQFRQLF